MNISGLGDGYGIEIDIPTAWEGRVWTQLESAPETSVPPTLHAGTFALPKEDGSFGTSAVEIMSPDDAFLALVSMGPAVAYLGIYSAVDIPTGFVAKDFDPTAMPAAYPGRAGLQRFFTAADHGFCLHIVLGSVEGGALWLDDLAAILKSLRIETLDESQSAVE